MNIINIKKPKAKRTHTCDLCGEPINLGVEYAYIKHRTQKTILHTKSHIECLKTAKNMDMIKLERITSYSFIKKVRDYIYELHIRGGAKVTKKFIEKQPISKLVNLVSKYYEELEAEEQRANNVMPSRDNIKEQISLFTMLFMMPTVMDNLIYEMESAKVLKHKVKRDIQSCLKDFERMSDRLSKVYSGNTELDNFCTNSMVTLEDIEANIKIEGIDRWANILMACVAEIKSKWTKVGKELKCVEQINDITLIEKKLSDVLTYTKYDFINFIVSECCSSKDINLVD